MRQGTFYPSSFLDQILSAEFLSKTFLEVKIGINQGDTLPSLLSLIKFTYFEKTTKFSEIFTLLFSYVVPIKTKVKILQNFVAFSEYMNFTDIDVGLV